MHISHIVNTSAISYQSSADMRFRIHNGGCRRTNVSISRTQTCPLEIVVPKNCSAIFNWCQVIGLTKSYTTPACQEFMNTDTHLPTFRITRIQEHLDIIIFIWRQCIWRLNISIDVIYIDSIALYTMQCIWRQFKKIIWRRIPVAHMPRHVLRKSVMHEALMRGAYNYI